MVAKPPTSATAALSCARQLERVVRVAMARAQPSLDLSPAPGAPPLPPLLGIRRNTQPRVAADYQTSLPLVLGNWDKQQQQQQRLGGPEALARGLAAAINDSNAPHGSCGAVREATAAPGGFLNLALADPWIAQQAVTMATVGTRPARIDDGSRRRVLVDYCAPNYGKRLHVGHLRSSVIGDTLANLLAFRGHDVARISHTGDVGAAFATLLAELLERPHDDDNDEAAAAERGLTDADLGRAYERGKRRAAADPAFKRRVDDLVLQLQRIGAAPSDNERASVDGELRLDPAVERLWRRACAVSRAAYARIFARLGVRVEDRGESTYLRLVPGLLDELRAKGLAVRSRGALGVFVDGPDRPPMLVQKQDGGYLYATSDLACLRSRIFGFPGVDDQRYDEIIYVTDASQQLHFAHLFKTAAAAGWLDRTEGHAEPVRLRHAWFGLVLGKDGAKLSSRNGAFDYLEDLLDEAGAECRRRALLSETTTTTGTDGEDEDHELHRRIGDAAVRYFDLAQHRERNYKFSFDQVLSLKGNTGVYLLYATARLHGILRRVRERQPGAVPGDSWASLLDADPATAAALLAHAAGDWTPQERALALLLAQFDDEVTLAVSQLAPHHLCDYLFRVVGHFHGFYEHCRVLGDPRQDARLVLCAATYAVLERGLGLLGIEAVERM